MAQPVYDHFIEMDASIQELIELIQNS